jgi:predicted phosphohydrolase
MALFAISDLHLSLGTDKPMDVFGGRWENYVEKLKENWQATVGREDVVIVNGDNSWATYVQDAKEDFGFIHSLPGIKLLSKGNHDYWWTTLAKQTAFCERHGFDTIRFLHNNYYMYQDIAICGTRGWQLTKNDEEDQKIYQRELGRLEQSISLALKENPRKLIAALHYPPDENFRAVLSRYGVCLCVYGHLHGAAFKNVVPYTADGVSYQLVSCDYLNFMPYSIRID